MDSVSFQRFEAARLTAQAKIQANQASRVNAQQSDVRAAQAGSQDLAALIDAKKKEMNSSSISGINRNTTIEKAPITGMFKNLGQIANQYLASQVSERELSSTPHQKTLGNYVDVSV